MSYIKRVDIGKGQTLQIRKFDLKKIASDATIAIIAKRGSGKSWIIRDILYHHRDLAGGVVIAPTNKLNHFYDQFIPPLYIYNNFTPDIIPKIFLRQQKILDKNDERKKIRKRPVDPRICLVMDDCMGEKDRWLKDTSILELFNNGRHYKVFYLLSMQYSLGIPPELRSNFDYVFLLSDNINTNKKRLYDHYAGMFPSFSIFKDVFEQITSNFGCMVIDNKSKSNNLQDVIFWFKATDRPPFKLGSRSYVKLHEKNYTGEHHPIVP